MSEGSFWPKTWKEAIPLIVWGILVFAAGFETIATLVHGEWGSSGASFVIMLGLTAMLLHWKAWLERLNPNWVAGAAVALLLVIVFLPFIRQGQWPSLSWAGFGVALVGTLLIVAIIGLATSLFIAVPKPHAAEAAAAASQVDGQTNLDVAHLLDFGVNETTYWMLDRLVEAADWPEVQDGLKFGPHTPQAHNARQFFLDLARREVGAGTFRQSDLANVVHAAQGEAEHNLEATPPDQRPSGIDHLILQRYMVSELQFVRVLQFLRRERRDVKDKLIANRHALIERVHLRENNRRR